MKERVSFETSGLIKNIDDKTEIEFWGHDAGEFVYENIVELLEESKDEAAIETKHAGGSTSNGE